MKTTRHKRSAPRSSRQPFGRARYEGCVSQPKSAGGRPFGSARSQCQQEMKPARVKTKPAWDKTKPTRVKTKPARDKTKPARDKTKPVRDNTELGESFRSHRRRYPLVAKSLLYGSVLYGSVRPILDRSRDRIVSPPSKFARLRVHSPPSPARIRSDAHSCLDPLLTARHLSPTPCRGTLWRYPFREPCSGHHLRQGRPTFCIHPRRTAR